MTITLIYCLQLAKRLFLRLVYLMHNTSIQTGMIHNLGMPLDSNIYVLFSIKNKFIMIILNFHWIL